MTALSALQRTVVFPLVNLVSTLHHMRSVRDCIKRDMHILEEGVKSGHDHVHNNSAVLALEAELSIVEESVRLLWQAYTQP
jgi:hypothetical protein